MGTDLGYNSEPQTTLPDDDDGDDEEEEEGVQSLMRVQMATLKTINSLTTPLCSIFERVRMAVSAIFDQPPDNLRFLLPDADVQEELTLLFVNGPPWRHLSEVLQRNENIVNRVDRMADSMSFGVAAIDFRMLKRRVVMRRDAQNAIILTKLRDYTTQALDEADEAAAGTLTMIETVPQTPTEYATYRDAVEAAARVELTLFRARVRNIWDILHLLLAWRQTVTDTQLTRVIRLMRHDKRVIAAIDVTRPHVSVSVDKMKIAALADYKARLEAVRVAVPHIVKVLDLTGMPDYGTVDIISASLARFIARLTTDEADVETLDKEAKMIGTTLPASEYEPRHMRPLVSILADVWGGMNDFIGGLFSEIYPIVLNKLDPVAYAGLVGRSRARLNRAERDLAAAQSTLKRLARLIPNIAAQTQNVFAVLGDMLREVGNVEVDLTLLGRLRDESAGLTDDSRTSIEAIVGGGFGDATVGTLLDAATGPGMVEIENALDRSAGQTRADMLRQLTGRRGGGRPRSTASESSLDMSSRFDDLTMDEA